MGRCLLGLLLGLVLPGLVVWLVDRWQVLRRAWLWHRSFGVWWSVRAVLRQVWCDVRRFLG